MAGASPRGDYNIYEGTLKYPLSSGVQTLTAFSLFLAQCHLFLLIA